MGKTLNYDVLCLYAGEYLADKMPEPVAIGIGDVVPELQAAVYIAVGVDGSVLYVGSVTRPGDRAGVRTRLSEHLRRQERFESWNVLYLVPLKPDTPLVEVRRIEGRIGAHLDPSKSRALPKLNRRRS